MNGLKTGMALAALALMPLETRAQEVAADPAAEALPEITYEDTGEKPAFLHSGSELTLGGGVLLSPTADASADLKLAAAYRFAWKANWLGNMTRRLFGAKPLTDEDYPFYTHQMLLQLELRKDTLKGFREDNVLGFWISYGGGCGQVFRWSGGFGTEFVLSDPQYESGFASLGVKLVADFFITNHLFLGLDLRGGLFVTKDQLEGKMRHWKAWGDDARNADDYMLFLHAGYAF